MKEGKPRITDPGLEAHIGANLRRFRIRYGLSQQLLADKLGITFQQVQKYESGVNRIAASTLYRLSKIMDIRIIDFFAGLDCGGVKEAPVLTREEAKILRLYAQMPSDACRRSIKNMMRSFDVARDRSGDGAEA